MKNENERCGSCTFWYALPADPMNLAAPKVGVCRALPPQSVVTGMQQTAHGAQAIINCMPPRTAENTPCCGKYEQRLELLIKN